MTTRQEEIQTAQKAAARRILERDFERIGMRMLQGFEQQMELAEERKEKEELWRLGGFGEPPEFQPTVSLVRAG